MGGCSLRSDGCGLVGSRFVAGQLVWALGGFVGGRDVSSRPVSRVGAVMVCREGWLVA